jgi:WD40 repeat protein
LLINNSINVWRVKTGQLIETLKGHDKQVVTKAGYYKGNGVMATKILRNPASVTAISFSRDGESIASASDDKTIEIWKVRTGKLTQILRGHTDAVYAVNFSHKSGLVATGGEDETIRLWSVSNGKLLKTVKSYVGSVHAVDFSPDGKRVIGVGQSGSATVWDVATGKLYKKISSDSAAQNIAFSADGGRFAIINRDHGSGGAIWGTVTVKDVTTGQLLYDFEVAPPDAIALSADGKCLAIGGVEYDKKYRNGHRFILQVWDIP